MPTKYLGRAEHIEVIGDESGFMMLFENDYGDKFRVNVHDVAGALLASAQDQIGNWIAEGEQDRATRHVTDDNSLHSVHADIWDGRQR